MIEFDVDDPAACEAHAVLGGRPGTLADLVDASRQARRRDSVVWHVSVTPANVYRLDALHRLAEDEGIQVRFRANADLDERERAFFIDYSQHRIADLAGMRTKRKLDALFAGAWEAADALVRTLKPGRPVGTVAREIRRVVIVGAYGGDHVGDAAILGGVLLALHARYGVVQATVMSFRPDHTRRLAKGLATPVHVSVERYTAARVARLLDEAGALVIAGGPIVDLPRVLAKHLGSAHAARALGRPLLIERVGLGSFHRRTSMWAARRIFGMASAFSVRSRDSSRHPLLGGRTASVGRDPAFDYLATRGVLDRLGEQERISVDRLLEGTGDSLLVGINLRPVSDDWHPLGAEHSRRVRARFIEAFAQAMEQFATLAGRPVTYVYFPMNAIQFGMSDLTSAYHLHRAVRGRVRLRVWEADPELDGVLYLLRKLDAAVVMRLHAAIFSIAQNLPVIGIDYFAGTDSKLTQLFSDLDRADATSSMEDFTSSWLVAQLDRKLRQATA
jgi:polysaccharide pyruvyl transferase WcaK-like protein